MPPPEALRQFEEIHPGLADRIMTMAENQATHRQRKEMVESKDDHGRIVLGQVLGFALLLGAIGAGTFLALNGQPVVGGIFGSTGIASAVLAYIKYPVRRREP